jgi:hypothetical protein
VTIRTAGDGVSTTGALLDGLAEISLEAHVSFERADRGAGILVHFAEAEQP